ncbi:WbqC family protein [Paenibacillus alba]|uniref:WbqC family protein n=1 Tax=Paenibacillus alba TaxID=1197127 RepID=A0ABU6GJ62_9BACL|nr:WbqC family protein [Paenibacillus alba]MEC0232689.1 WbqC family protein [Paenibacillus alba]
MKLAIMQPYLFPYIGYFQLIYSVDQFIIYDDVQFINRGWINRNRVLVNNTAHLFTFSVRKDSRDLNINDRYFSLQFEFEKNKFKNGLQLGYKKAPNYNETMALIDNIFSLKELNVSSFITNQIKMICSYLGIQTKISLSSELDTESHLKAEERIIDICKKVDASHYINPIGGQELYSRDRFSKEGISLSFLKTNSIIYPQFKGEFVSFLSIIDVMMFNSKDQINKIISEYELI